MTRISELIADFNAEKQSEQPDVAKLAGIRKVLDDEVASAAKLKKDSVYGALMGAINPMVEAARQYSYEVDTYKEIKDSVSGDLMGLELSSKAVVINPVEVTKMVVTASSVKGSTIPKNGVVKNGHSWEYGLERLGCMLAYRKAKELGANDDRLKQIVGSYYVSEAAVKEANGEKPTSNKKTADALQEIVDKMVFVPGKFGKNAISITGADVTFMTDNAIVHRKAKDGSTIMKMDSIRNLQSRLFEMVSKIITDTPYDLTYRMKDKNGVLVAQPSRNPRSTVKNPILLNADGSLMVFGSDADETTTVEKPASKKAKKPDVAAESAEVEKIA